MANGTHESFKVRGPSPFDDKSVLRGATGREALSEPFEFEVDILPPKDAKVKYDDVLGEPLSLEIELPENRKRFVHGIVVKLGYIEVKDDRYVYRLTLRPWFWLLKNSSNSRIFQEKTSIQIIKDVFEQARFSDFEDGALTGTYHVREYCVQYRESDFDFVCRLLEEEGIYYYFKYEQSKHTLVLADAASAHSATPGYGKIEYHPAAGGELSRDREGITEWFVSRSVRSGTYSLRDYDFEKPKTDLTVKSSDPASHAHAKLEVYDYPGRYSEATDGKSYAEIRREALQVPYEVYHGKADVRGLSVGTTFNLVGTEDFDMEYLITSALHDIQSDEVQLGASEDAMTSQVKAELTAIDNRRQFRPTMTTPKGLVRGPQTAVVVGPDGEEIWTDKYGRVKLQFHWDREGKLDEKSSCWIRVSHAWAGKKWGQIFLPRIGQEVIVDFLEGDPDRPIVTGRVYNADNMPPYTLPDEKNKSTMKSHSTLKGVDKNFNELRFDDTKDKEEVYFHAERDFNRVVENNDTLKVGFDKKDKGDQTIEIFNNQDLKIGASGADDGSQSVEVWKDQTVKIGLGSGEGSQTLTIERDRTTTLNQGNDVLTVSSGNRTVSISSGSQETDASKHILFTVGSSSLKIEPSKITLSSPTIVVKASQDLDMKAGMNAKLKAGMNLDLQGGMNLKAKGGMNLDLKGGMNAKMAGGLTAKMQGAVLAKMQGAFAVIQGALTKIN